MTKWDVVATAARPGAWARLDILKRLLIHTGGFNLGLLMRQLIGVGTPRGLQGRTIAVLSAFLTLTRARWKLLTRRWSQQRLSSTLAAVLFARHHDTHIGVG